MPLAGSGHPRDAAHDPAEREWVRYFDTLVEAAQTLLGASTQTPEDPHVAPPVFPAVEQPSLPLPASLTARRTDVALLLTDATRHLELRQADVARQLAALRPRPTRSAYLHQVGDSLDLLG